MQFPLCTDTVRLQLVSQALPIILMEWTHTGVVTFAQGCGLQYLGITPAHVLGCSVFELVQHDPDIQTYVQSALAGESFTTVVMFRDRIFEVYYRPIFESLHRELRVVSIALDVTERTLLGEHLLRRLTTLLHGNYLLRDNVEPIEAACAMLATQASTAVPCLSPREVEILGCVSRGMRNATIGRQLNIEQGTVKWHLAQVYRKLGVSSRMEAVHRARCLNLLDEDGSAA